MKTASKIVMAITGTVLLVASALKIHQLLTEPIISKGFWESWQFFVIQIPLEMGLGIWLISGLFHKAAWLAAVIAFGVFIGVTLQKGIAGLESCGCFGKVHVNPWITLAAIDIPVFIGLLLLRPKGEKLLPPPWPKAKHLLGVAIPAAALIGSIVPILVFNKPPEKTNDYEVVRPEQWTTTTPALQPPGMTPATQQPPARPAAQDPNNPQLPIDQPTGPQQPTSQTPAPEPWPMLQHIDIAPSLRSGIVVVLLYHYDCPDCRQAISSYDQLARELTGNEDAVRFAFIEVPPYGPPGENPLPPGTPCLTGKLSDSKKWYMTTPLVVTLANGSPVRSWQSETPDLEQILDSLSPSP
jgi:thiol-disulfide isomerase/thioredoxin